MAPKYEKDGILAIAGNLAFLIGNLHVFLQGLNDIYANNQRATTYVSSEEKIEANGDKAQASETFYITLHSKR